MKKRAERIICFLVACFLLNSEMSAFGQDHLIAAMKGFAGARVSFADSTRGIVEQASNGLLSGKYDYLTGRDSHSGMTAVPSDIYYTQSGFFCKREWELERSTHVPFRFRLGSLDQCNALEGKQH